MKLVFGVYGDIMHLYSYSTHYNSRVDESTDLHSNEYLYYYIGSMFGYIPLIYQAYTKVVACTLVVKSDAKYMYL